MNLYEIAEKIQQLETFYAERLGDDADFAELNDLWEKIKTLRKQLLFAEIFEDVRNSSQSITLDL